jgi:hypothetical protein
MPLSDLVFWRRTSSARPNTCDADARILERAHGHLYRKRIIGARFLGDVLCKALGTESEQQGSLHRVRIYRLVQQGVAKLAVAGAFYLRLFDPAMPKGGLY